MAHTLNPTRSAFLDDPWPAKSSGHANVGRAALNSRQPSLGKRALRSLIIFCIGIIATLAWQSYGDAVRGMIANSYPQLGWLAPQSEAFAQTAPNMVAQNVPAIPSPDAQQLVAMSLGLAALRQ